MQQLTDEQLHNVHTTAVLAVLLSTSQKAIKLYESKL